MWYGIMQAPPTQCLRTPVVCYRCYGLVPTRGKGVGTLNLLLGLAHLYVIPVRTYMYANNRMIPELVHVEPRIGTRPFPRVHGGDENWYLFKN
jgi:hypothetical protein